MDESVRWTAAGTDWSTHIPVGVREGIGSHCAENGSSVGRGRGRELGSKEDDDGKKEEEEEGEKYEGRESGLFFCI